MSEHTRLTLEQAYGTKRAAEITIRSFAEPIARGVIGDEYVDGTNPWLGWDVLPVYRDCALVALDLVKLIYDDRGPTQRTIVRHNF